MSHRVDDIERAEGSSGPPMFGSNAIIQRAERTDFIHTSGNTHINKTNIVLSFLPGAGEHGEGVEYSADIIDTLKTILPTVLREISKDQSQPEVEETTDIGSSSAPPQPIKEISQNQSESQPEVEEVTSIGGSNARPRAITEIHRNQEQAEVGDTTRIDSSSPLPQDMPTDHTPRNSEQDAVNVQNIPSDVLSTASSPRTIAEKYTRNMLKCLTGYPLYEPTPLSEFSKEYLREGIRAGDVGFITEDGTFDFLFNIRPSQNDEINPPEPPHLQSLILQESEDLGVSPTMTNLGPTCLFHHPVKEKRPVFGCTRYTCSELEGAILELPEGATRFEVRNKLLFKELAIRCGVEWYKYTMERGRDITNGSLYLVTSYTKCTHWGIAVVNRPCASREGLRFVHNKGLFGNPKPKYNWKGSKGAFTTTVAPTSDGNVLNQCMFLGGYKIKLREDIWKGLIKERKGRAEQRRGNFHIPMTSSSPHQTGNTGEPRNQDHYCQRETGPRTSEPATDSDRHSREPTNPDLPTMVPVTESDEVIVDADFDPPLVHPSDLINAALLSQEPGAKIAITHDDAWCNLLRDIFLNPKPLDLAKIAQSYTSLIDKYGCISFEEAPDSSPSDAKTSPPVQTTGSPALKELDQQEEPAASDKHHRMPEAGSRGTNQNSTATTTTTTTPITPKDPTIDENSSPGQFEESESPVVKQSFQDRPSTKAPQDDTRLPTPQTASAGLKGTDKSSASIRELLHSHRLLSYDATAFYKDIDIKRVDNKHNATATALGSVHHLFFGASMFSNVNANILGGEFINANRDIYKIVINSGHDVTETLQAALPSLLEEIAGNQIQPVTDGKTGINDIPSEDPVAIETAESGPSSSLEIRSVADRYTRSMLKCLTGYPLYVPQPYSDFSGEVYSRKGVCIGDVGIITKDGAFEFLFNICPSQNSLVNPRQLPGEFILKTTDNPNINHKEQFPAKSHIFESPVSRTNSLLQGPRYTSSESGGAILELPEGAFQDDATSTFPFRKFASRYGEQWYKYTIGTRGKDVLNGSLYLVTSCTKCTQWGIAVFDLPCTPQDSLRFVQNKGVFRDSGSKYRWKGSRTFTTKVAPSEGSNSLNQCVFVQGYKIMLRQDIFINLRNDLFHGPPQASSSSRTLQSGMDSRQHRVPARRNRGGSGPGPGRRRQVEPTTGEVMLYNNFNLPPVHPSDFINSALLEQKPGAKVALTHDNDWRDLVKDISNNLENLDLAKIARTYGVSAIDENGCVYFERIPDKSLVIAIDVGTTFSGVSYSLLDPGKKPRIQPVTRFAGQREIQGNPRVPSVVCYDQYGNFIAAGSEADSETNPLLSDINGVRCAEWFKLRLRLPHLAANKRAELQKLWLPPEPAEDEAHDEIEDDVLLEIEGDWASMQEPKPAKRHFLPVTDDFKNPVQVFADFLRYLFKSAKEYIIEAESNLDPTFSWTSVERNTYFVLTHPNGWEEEQSKMREAAVAAGLVNMSAAVERITFLTEGEANLHFCLEKNPNLQQERNGLLVVDCGSGTIDLSAYSWAEEGGFREIASPDCLLQGSVFVTSRARDHFKGRFKDSEFGSDDDVEAMVKAFDKPDGVKCMFSDPSIPYYVKFGDLRDTDRTFGIVGGKFRVEGAQVARFFEPAVNDIIGSIRDQYDKAKWNGSSIKIILLVGGFGSSNYLYTRLNDYFRPKGITIHRLLNCK